MTHSIFVVKRVCVLCYSPRCSCPPCRRPAGPVCTEFSHSSASTRTSPAQCCCTAPAAHRCTLLRYSGSAEITQSAWHTFSPSSCWDQLTFLQSLYFMVSVRGTQSIICQLTRHYTVYTTVLVSSLEGHFNESYSHRAAFANDRQESLSFWLIYSFFLLTIDFAV